MSLHDALGRPLKDLRISVTDRCNFRCTYCMPRDIFGSEYGFLERSQLLSFEEIARWARLFLKSGVRKLRLTGGEPLLRQNIARLVGMLAKLDGLEDLAMTTNGALLAQTAHDLRQAGLKRLTVSLDALDDEAFKRMNDVGYPVSKVLAGIEAAVQAGLPVKVNMVVRRGVNEDRLVAMAEHFRGSDIVVRFIEYMDVGSVNGWRLDEVVPGSQVLAALAQRWALEPVDPDYRGEVAKRYRYRDGGGEIGIICSVTQPFCGDCTRLRLTAAGELYTCLFGTRGHDLRAAVRSGASDTELVALIARIWSERSDRYSELRSSETLDLPKVEMSRVGG